MDQIFSIILTKWRYNIYFIYKTFELNMLIHLNCSTKHFHIYIYINHFIFISNQIHFNYFHFGYQITNSAQLSGTLQMGGLPQMFLLRLTEPNTTSTSNL